jgi:branched-chain amino acid transport system substrate-binding protein
LACAGLLMFITDVDSLGLNVTQGMYVADAWYRDRTPTTRAWGGRYFDKMKKEPSSTQAADHSATITCLNAVKAVGTDDPKKVMGQMKATKINDMFATHGVVRADGRMVHDVYLMQVKTPAESKDPWVDDKLAAAVPCDPAFATQAESKRALWQ